MVTDTTLKTAWEANIEWIRLIDNQTKNNVVNKVMRELALPLNRLVIRPMLASDLNLELWQTPILSKLTKTTWIDTIIADMRFITVTKIIQLSKEPKVSEISFIIGGEVRSIFELDQLYSIIPILDSISDDGNTTWILHKFGDIHNIRMEAYLTSPLICPQNTHFKIDITATDNSEIGDRIVLGGYVVEPFGMRIR